MTRFCNCLHNQRGFEGSQSGDGERSIGHRDIEYKTADIRKGKHIKRLCIFILIASLVLGAFSVINIEFVKTTAVWHGGVWQCVLSICSSVFAGALISLVLDIPGLITSFKTMILDALTEDRYLNSLPSSRLKEIRKKTIRQIHAKASHVPDSLLGVDSLMCDLVGRPYYNYFNESVATHAKQKMESETKDSALYNKKDVAVEYEIINPMGDSKCIADISLRKAFDIGEREIQKMFEILIFELSIDGSAPICIFPNISYYNDKSEKTFDVNVMTYDTHLSLSHPEGKIINAENVSGLAGQQHENQSFCYVPNTMNISTKLEVEFNRSIHVKYKYRQFVNNEDCLFTRRMRYPTREYVILYSSEDNVQLHGQLLGTNIVQKGVTLMQNDKKHLMIQCRDWLLPGDGVFIVADDKQ